MPSLFKNAVFPGLLLAGAALNGQAAETDSATLDVILNVPEPTQYVRLPDSWAGRVNTMIFDRAQRRFFLPVALLTLRNDSGGFSATLETAPELAGQNASIPLTVSLCGKRLSSTEATSVLSPDLPPGVSHACPVDIRSSAVPENQPPGDYSGVIVMKFSATS
ncbi:hypothetical protein [Pantoea sp. AMG 501]|uniref:hypothetical protein n=1 Tax=Pantoea sp. AMG 501 TaxID=2008894 RepID=UPI000B5A7741|nr:hypothetical protein [Pantoea sp. AMG 501]OWY74550.1 hypothetical protein CDN97_22875 [Pantoea sp. AMG 501]